MSLRFLVVLLLISAVSVRGRETGIGYATRYSRDPAARFWRLADGWCGDGREQTRLEPIPANAANPQRIWVHRLRIGDLQARRWPHGEDSSGAVCRRQRRVSAPTRFTCSRRCSEKRSAIREPRRAIAFCFIAATCWLMHRSARNRHVCGGIARTGRSAAPTVGQRRELASGSGFHAASWICRPTRKNILRDRWRWVHFRLPLGST